MSDNWFRSPIWDEWGRLTRLQWSGTLAIETELDRWEAKSVGPDDNRLIRSQRSGGQYRLYLQDHLKSLQDTSLFYGLILVRSYSLMEFQAKLVKYMIAEDKTADDALVLDEDTLEQVADLKLQGGLQAWTGELMKKVGQDWSDVYGGLEGLVEIALLRNQIVHGQSRSNAVLAERARVQGAAWPFEDGALMVITFDLLHEYRGRMRSFCRIVGDGLVHRARGTHRSVAKP
ncbi:hypothetical protein [Minwuia sp.]|uniref:hypothetical protein n=1 Tax=Minwuia sp. TaxID=2493630 RepID=UPI003A94AA8A